LGDPDVEVPRWLEVGAPFGVNLEIVPGSWFPVVEDPYDGGSLWAPEVRGNHPSFLEEQGLAEPPGLTWVKEQLNSNLDWVKHKEDLLSKLRMLDTKHNYNKLMNLIND